MEVIGMMFLSWGGFAVSIVSLVIAIISLVKSSKAQLLQNKLNEIELQIKRNELDKIEKEKADNSTACVEARIISLGTGKYKLKVWNSGFLIAYNIKVSFVGDPEIIMFAEGLLPYDELDPKKSFEISLLVHFDSSQKARVLTEWEDKNGKQYSKEQMVSL